jgi:hypothetical protein
MSTKLNISRDFRTDIYYVNGKKHTFENQEKIINKTTKILYDYQLKVLNRKNKKKKFFCKNCIFHLIFGYYYQKDVEICNIDDYLCFVTLGGLEFQCKNCGRSVKKTHIVDRYEKKTKESIFEEIYDVYGKAYKESYSLVKYNKQIFDARIIFNNLRLFLINIRRKLNE